MTRPVLRPWSTRSGPKRSRPVPARYVVIGILLFVTVVSGLPYLIASQDAQRPESESVLTPLQLPPAMQLSDLQEARVIEVVDGDTIDVILDGHLERVRYFGIDAPERGDRCFREATDRNLTLIGSRVLLLADAREEDSGRRLLRYVFLPDGTSVDATMVAEGFASAWREDGRYRDQLLTTEEEARAATRGCLWK
jgi:micrococcal nuclease